MAVICTILFDSKGYIKRGLTALLSMWIGNQLIRRSFGGFLRAVLLAHLHVVVLLIYDQMRVASKNSHFSSFELHLILVFDGCKDRRQR